MPPFRPHPVLQQMLDEGKHPVRLSELIARIRRAAQPREQGQVQKRQTRFNHNDGPMMYLGEQIVKAMQDAGRPAKILWCYRSPEQQDRLYSKGRREEGAIVTNASAFRSPHQYMEAVDIIHPTLGWGVTEDYWDTLAVCVRTVAEKYGIELDHGHHWRFRDSAHVQLWDWRGVIERYDPDHEDMQWKPSPGQLWQRFQEVLPKVAKRLEQDGRAPQNNP